MSARQRQAAKCCLRLHLHACRDGEAHACTNMHLLGDDDLAAWKNMVSIGPSTRHGLRACHPDLFGTNDTARYGDLESLRVCRRAHRYLHVHVGGKPAADAEIDAARAALAVQVDTSVAVAAKQLACGHEHCAACLKRFVKKRDGASGRPQPDGGEGKVRRFCNNDQSKELKRKLANGLEKARTPRRSCTQARG